MKIKKDSKFLFYASLIVSAGIIMLNIYRFFNNELNLMDLIMDLSMLFVMIGCMSKFVEKK
ncbi:MAG: hypothetical protein IJO43_02630 [Bacilli bacterium]|nr:hypothetical protein [Bacilli bacterium]